MGQLLACTLLLSSGAACEVGPPDEASPGSDTGEAQAAGDPLPADGQLTAEQAAQYLRDNPVPATLAAMTGDQRRAWCFVLKNHVTPALLSAHEAWHSNAVNLSGGTTGPLSGITFLGMHRAMLRAAENRIGGNFRVPLWDTTQPLPAEMSQNVAAGHPDSRVTSDPNVSVPGWLTASGTGVPPRAGTRGVNLRNTVQTSQLTGSNITGLGSRTFSRLGDFANPDELGRIIGMSGYHGSVHAAIGGVMTSFNSPSDACAFYPWHGRIDRYIDDWLATPAGQQWRSQNPNHPILNLDTPIAAYDTPTAFTNHLASVGQ